jgi:hypothetical protein
LGFFTGHDHLPLAATSNCVTLLTFDYPGEPS